MQTLPHTHSCFVCGESNPAGLNMRFETDGRIVRAQFRPQPQHIGFKGVVHGGIIATVLDEIMVWACAVQARRFAFCAEMSVRFLQPLAPGSEAIVTAELVTNRKDRIYEAKGSVLTSAGDAIAEATGKYIPIKSDQLPAMMEELIGGRDWLKATS